MTEQDNIVTLTTTEGIASLITRLRKEESNCASVYIIDAAIETIERLVKERDEARREVCEFELVNMKQAYEYATHRGWDCYKEKTQ
jgi:hypothetical protein